MEEIPVDRETIEADPERDRGVLWIRVETILEETTPMPSQVVPGRITTSALFAAAR